MNISLNKKILALLVVSILILIGKVVFKDTPELFKGGEVLFDDILYDLAVAYIGSVIFYYLIVYFPQIRDRQNILRYTVPHTKNIYGYGLDVINQITGVHYA